MDQHRVALRPPAGLRVLGAALTAVFVGGFFAWPVLSIIGRGLRADALSDLVTNPGIRSVAWFTTWQAGLSTAATVAVGLPVAYVTARFRFPGRRALLAFVTVPFVLPTVVVGAAFLSALPESWHQTAAAVVIAHVFFNVAVVVRSVGGLWGQLDRGLEEAARTLGASPVRVMRFVTLPLLRPAILAASSIVFLFTFTSYGVVTVLGGPRNPTIEVELYRRAVLLGDLPVAAALALVQLGAVSALLWWWTRVPARTPQVVPLGAAPRRPGTVRERLVVGGVTAAIVGFTGWPLGALVLRSFHGRTGLTTAGWRAVGSQGWAALAVSLRFAFAAMAVATVIGGLAALTIGAGGRLARALDSGLMVPLGTSAVTLGFGMLITFDTPPFDLRDSAVIIPIAHALVGVPFVVRMVVPTLRAIDPDLGAAAATLGADPWRRFLHIDARLAGRSLLAGAGFAFAVSLGEFGATSFLTRRGRTTLPIEIARSFARPGDLAVARGAALATVLLIATALAVTAVDRLRPEDAAW